MGSLRKATVAVFLPWFIGIGIWAASTNSARTAAGCAFLTVLSILYLADQ